MLRRLRARGIRRRVRRTAVFLARHRQRADAVLSFAGTRFDPETRRRAA